MKKIYIKESQLSIISDNLNKEKEVTFYEFFINIKSFLKDLLNKPYEAKPSELFNSISKDELLKKMKDKGIVISSERIDEVPESDGSSKKVAKHFIMYKIPKNNFEGKIKTLYNEMYKKDSLNEDGATSCGSVMQGGGGNPDSGQYTTPMSPVQRRKFWEPALKRNKDEKNNSISMNRK